MSQLFSNNIGSLNTTNINFTVTDDRSNILAWLSPLDPRSRHKDIQGRRVGNVGEWILQTKEFRSWCASSEGGVSDNKVFFCYGGPGVGKTYISSLVIDSLCDQARGQNATVACFYFDFATQNEQSPTNMLGSLLKQLVCGQEEIPEEISRAYRDQQNAIGGRELQLSDIVKMLQAISSKKRTFICVDALDECVEGHRVKLLDSLNQILQGSPGTRIFITGRLHVVPEIGRRLARRVTSISISPRRDDIISYLHSKLDEDTNPDAMDSILEADILKKIPEDVSEIFLLVSLNIDVILQETTIHHRRQKLNSMTDGLGLGGAYGATLGRIKGQGGRKARLGMATLMWISHAERPLRPDELCHALAVEIGSPSLNADNIPSIGTVLACCQGLAFVDKEASTIRLIHFSLQEYLRAHPELFGPAHSIIAETCLSYLNSQQVKAFSTSSSSGLQITPFLIYSSLYWGMHAKRELSDCTKLLALKLFDDCSSHISIEILLRAGKFYYHNFRSNEPHVFSSLHCASLFGIDEIITGLVEVEGCDINQEDSMYNTPLLWAAWNGHEGVVKILLGRGHVNPNKKDVCGKTPLHCAAEKGHEGVVKILLGRKDVNPDKPGFQDQTPLHCAAQNGHEGVVKILLGREDVNPDKPDDLGITPLSFAAQNGHEGVVKILLGREDVSPDKPDGLGQTPLSHAAENGCDGVVKTLLKRDVNLDQLDDFDLTPLGWAIRNGHPKVIALLQPRKSITHRMA